MEVETPIPVEWETVRLERHWADLIVEKSVVVELKSVENVAPVHKKVLLTYLRLTDRASGCSSTFWRGAAEGRHSSRGQ